MMWQIGQNCLTCHITPFRRGVRSVLLWPVNCRKPSVCPGERECHRLAASLSSGRKLPPAPQACCREESHRLPHKPSPDGKCCRLSGERECHRLAASLSSGRKSPPAPQAFPHLMIPFTSSYMSPHRRHICFGELLKRLRRVRASLRRSWVLRVRIVFIWNSSMQISFRCWRIS